MLTRTDAITADAARPATSALPAFSTFSTKAGFAAVHTVAVLLRLGWVGGWVSKGLMWYSGVRVSIEFGTDVQPCQS